MRKVLSLLVVLVLSTVLIYFIINLSDLKAYKPNPALSVNRQGDITASRGGGFQKLASPVLKDAVNSDEVIIKAMTYNIHRGINREGKLNLDDIGNIIKASEADVISLQEVERHSIRTRFKDQVEILANELSMSYAYGKSINILNGQYGNAILTKYPIEEYRVFELPIEGERRTLLRALININGYKLYAFSTHLGLDAAEREKQISEIKGIIEASEFDYILMGDFNTTVDKLEDIKEICLDTAEFFDEHTQSTYESDKLSERIDYIFLSSKLLPLSYNIINSNASDHYPVVVELRQK